MVVRPLLAWLVVAAAATSVGAGYWLLNAGPGASQHSTGASPILDRPEVRGSACPSDGAMVWRTSSWEMEIGPVIIYFAGPAVGTRGEVFAARYSGRGLVQKLPLRIDAAPGTSVRVHGINTRSGQPLTWEGPGSTALDSPVAERGFLPGAMAFPETGCYQVFVDVDGASYGPFGFVVAESHQTYQWRWAPRPPTNTATASALTEASAIAHDIV